VSGTRVSLRPISALAAALLVVASVVTAQEKTPTAKPEGPKPPPELDALSYFVAPFTSEGEIKPGPLGEGGPTKGREICRWAPGHFFVGCMMESQSPLGVSQVQAMMGWDAEKKVYRWWSFDNTGRAEEATGTFKGGTWTWSGESKMGDKLYKTRYIISDTRAEGYTYSLESSPDGKKWTTVMTGKATRAMPRPTPTGMPGGMKPPATFPGVKATPAVTPAAAPTKSP
jgi:hypothetical protein